MTRILLLALVIIALCALPIAVSAAIHDFEASLDGLFEVGPISTTASGFGTFVYDDVAHTLTSTVTYSGLMGSYTAAHIQNAEAGVNGPAVFAFPTPGSPLFGIFTLDASQAAELFAERFYVNVYSTTYPGGEIRGQIVAVPEPSSLVALTAFGGALFLRRRRQ